MTEPCTPHCPAGDCAGCAFPVALSACRPSRDCVQSHRCERALMSRGEVVIDATALKVGRFCPLFVDARGAMLEAA